MGAILLAIVTLVSAAMTAVVAEPTREVKLATPFELKPKEEVRVATTGVVVRFTGVSADSRCPTDVQCVWSGDAAVEIVMERPPAAASTATLHTVPRIGGDAEYEGVVVHLESVKPVRKTTAQIASEDYRVTLIVRRK